jgi:hypothetical protein
MMKRTKLARNAGRLFTGKSRTQERIETKLGRVPGENLGQFKRYRDEELHRLDTYLNNTQYDHLLPWDAGDRDTYIPLRNRKPRVIYNLGKRLCSTVAAKLLGEQVFPAFRVEEDPETEYVLQLILQMSRFRLHTLQAMQKACATGSSFVRFWFVGGKIRMTVYDSKHCYPRFDEAGELQEIEVRYVYDDTDDLDERGAPKKKWYRLLLSSTTDILFDNPEFKPGGEAPAFEEVARADHDLGFVQGQWFKTSESIDCPDGESLLVHVTDLIDSLNYSLSQADQAVAYAQEPQLAIKGMDVDEVENLVKSSERAWNLGRDGEAKFVEANLGGVERGEMLRAEKKQKIADVARVCLLDPEKIVGSAQSAKAMEVLHGPLVELVDELRTVIEDDLIALLTKLLSTLLILEQRGMNEYVMMPPGWLPKNTQITCAWPPIFPMTMEDLRAKVSVGVQAANASLLSRETVTKWIAKDFGVENIEEEVAKVAAQPVLNPFGAF